MKEPHISHDGCDVDEIGGGSGGTVCVASTPEWAELVAEALNLYMQSKERVTLTGAAEGLLQSHTDAQTMPESYEKDAMFAGAKYDLRKAIAAIKGKEGE